MPAEKDVINESMRLEIQVSRNISSQCRLCQLRSEPEGWLWAIITIPGHRLEVYCADCYEILYDRASEHLPELPNPHQEGRSTLNFSVEIPAYLVKNGKGLRFFWPEDPIDLGLIRQRAKRKRETAKEEKP